jgi:peptidoglycan/xylan/chitin deacetylase (PgdA/CDA1 family)
VRSWPAGSRRLETRQAWGHSPLPPRGRAGVGSLRASGEQPAIPGASRRARGTGSNSEPGRARTRRRSRRRGRASFALTFDDGYHDNLSAAKPILEERGAPAPATVFVTSGFVGGQPFWWDELGELLLDDTSPPGRIELRLDGVSRSWNVTTTARRHVFDEVWALLQGLDDDARRRALATLRAQLSASPYAGGRSLRVAEVTELAQGDLVSIGAHTQTHPVLARLNDDVARAEVVESKEWLEDVLHEPVTAFSYPYGGSDHYGRNAVEIVRAAGFELACSGEPGPVTPRCDPLQLPRVTVKNWDGNVLEKTLADLTRQRRPR